MTKKYVITIGRQLGSGGAITGKAIAEHFGFRYIDKEFLVIAAEKFGTSAEKMRNFEEKEDVYWTSMVYTAMHVIPYIGQDWKVATNKPLFDAQTRILLESAEEESCVVIGRCGSYLFREHENHVSIFLKGDIDSRVDRLERTLGKKLDTSKDIKAIEKEDRERANYYHLYTGREWMDMNEYDFVLDTSKLTDEQIKSIIIGYIETKFPELKKETGEQ